MPTATTPRPRERLVQSVILHYLALRRAMVVRTNSGGMKVDDRFVRFNSAKGCSDLLVCYRGRWVSLEVKRDAKAKATTTQLEFLADVARAGGVGAVVWDIDGVAAILDAIDTEIDG